MNASVYVFGELAHGYEQYPDDFTHSIFRQLYEHAKGPTQLALHREGELMYYGYIRRLNYNKYIGFCVVLNGLMLNNLQQIFPIFENTVSSIVTRGDLLHYNKEGDVVPSTEHLRKYPEELEMIKDTILSGFNRLDRFLVNLPPIDYGSPNRFAKIFQLDSDTMTDMVQSSYSNAFTLIYKMAGYNSDQMNGYSRVIRELHDDNEALESKIHQLQSEIEQMRYRERNYTWVSILAAIVVVLGAIIYFNVISPDAATEYETGTYTYYGPLDGTQPNGMGVAFYPPDDEEGRSYYIGNFVDGVPQDVSAVLLYNNGALFKGKMMNGNMQQGIYYDINKSFFVGTFDFNQPSTGVWYEYKATERIVDGKKVK